MGFFLVLIMGLGLHAATNVYNDIYDTKQGTDRINLNRNEFSGGSGILIQFPHLMAKMFFLARISLLIALLATIGLMFVIDRDLWIHLWFLYGISAFFSKYYTAAPVKLASRGYGEISVWFAFGPMAILVASVSQNLGFHELVVLAMPATGISTLSILLVGELIDHQADKASGKWGLSVRIGTKFTAVIYTVVQLILMTNIAVLGIVLPQWGWLILISLVPYLIFLPKVSSLVFKHHRDAQKLKPAAKINVQLHLLFSILLAFSTMLFWLI
jgi:1,4-dihydroxy-2-naphthoate octaprenyltransferase